MTAYPVTCLVQYDEGYRTAVMVEDASDTNIEAGAIKRLVILADNEELRIHLSPEAVNALVKALRRARR